MVSVATGNAARFDKIVAEYAKAPAVTRDRMYIETMQQILSSTSKVMIDTKAGNNTIYLPLDRLLAQSTANEAARGANSGPMMAPQQQNPAQPQAQQPAPAQPQPQTEAAAGESNRTRDLRSRDTGRERESR